MRLDGTVAVVTGAAQGIGRAIADSLAQAGARVVIGGLQAARPVVGAIRADGGEACSVIMDTSVRSDADILMDPPYPNRTVDILVNNAESTRQRNVWDLLTRSGTGDRGQPHRDV
jgi:3-oxoacyl-[acyl-carrier protein] reductase